MNTLNAEKRDLKVKAKKLRREGYVTGNLFGRKLEASIPVKMDKRSVAQLLNHAKKGNEIKLVVDGQDYLVLLKDIQYNPFAKGIDEVDFQALVSNEKVHTTAEIVYLNEEMVTTGVLQINISEISYKAYPAALVDEVKVDVGSLKLDDVLRVKDLDIAKNKDIELMTDPETVVASVLAPEHNVSDDEEEEA